MIRASCASDLRPRVDRTVRTHLTVTVASWQASVVLSPLHTHGCPSRPAWLGWLCVVGGPVDMTIYDVMCAGSLVHTATHAHAPTSALPAAANPPPPAPAQRGRGDATRAGCFSFPTQQASTGVRDSARRSL